MKYSLRIRGIVIARLSLLLMKVEKLHKQLQHMKVFMLNVDIIISDGDSIDGSANTKALQYE